MLEPPRMAASVTSIRVGPHDSNDGLSGLRSGLGLNFGFALIPLKNSIFDYEPKFAEPGA
jgi:hypothetical protein